MAHLLVKITNDMPRLSTWQGPSISLRDNIIAAIKLAFTQPSASLTDIAQLRFAQLPPTFSPIGGKRGGLGGKAFL